MMILTIVVSPVLTSISQPKRGSNIHGGREGKKVGERKVLIYSWPYPNIQKLLEEIIFFPSISACIYLTNLTVLVVMARKY